MKLVIYSMGATCVVQPLDLVKNRMQLSGEGGKAKEYKTSFHAIQGIIKKEGVVAMYNGLSAGLLRQATYTTTRLGIYTWLFETFSGWDLLFLTNENQLGNIYLVILNVFRMRFVIFEYDNQFWPTINHTSLVLWGEINTDNIPVVPSCKNQEEW